MLQRLARLLGLALLFHSLPVFGADDATERARKLFQAGRELYQQARYREAIVEFERAYALRPHGAIQFNIGQCFEKLGELPEAVTRYRRYLAEVPKAEDRATILLVIENLEKRHQESTPQPLLIRSAPPGAETYVDGERRGITPFEVVVKPGKHRLELALPRHLKATREVETRWDRPTEVDFILEVEAAPLTFWNKPRLWTWVALGSAAVAGATGGYFGYLSQRADAELRLQSNPNRPTEELDRLYEGATKNALIANVLFAGTAVAGVAGVTLFVLEGRF